jgi:hypothetical protein
MVEKDEQEYCPWTSLVGYSSTTDIALDQTLDAAAKNNYGFIAVPLFNSSVKCEQINDIGYIKNEWLHVPGCDNTVNVVPIIDIPLQHEEVIP